MEKILNQTIYGTSDSDAHLVALLGISLSLKAKGILELGVRDGDTTLPLLYSAYLNRGSLCSIDIKPTAFVPPPELDKYWTFIESDAISCLEDMVKENMKFDLVFVDDWHSYEHVYRELELIDHLTTPSSVIILHDLMYGNHQPNYYGDWNDKGEFANGGPFRAVDEFVNPEDGGWEYATIPSSHGLTILRKK